MLLGKGSYSTLLPNLAVSKNFSQLFMTKSSVHLFQLSPDLGVSTSHSTSARKRTVRPWLQLLEQQFLHLGEWKEAGN